MQPRRNSTLIYGLLLGVWVLVVAWQIEEHVRVREAAKTDLRKRSEAIANTIGAVVRGLQFRGAVFRDRWSRFWTNSLPATQTARRPAR